MDARPDYVPSSPLDDPLYAIPEEDHNRQNQRQSAESATRAPRFAQAEDEVKVRFRNLVVSTYDAYMKNMPVTKELTIVFDKYDMVESFKVGGDYVMANDFNDDLRRFSTNPQYIPPEVGTGRSYQKQAVEVWILGITLFWMLANKFPFSAKNDRTLLKKMSRSDFTIPSYLSNESKDLIRRMLAPDPKRRASFDLILFHPWMNSVPSIAVSPVDTAEHGTMFSFPPPLDQTYQAPPPPHTMYAPQRSRSVMRNVLSSAASGVRTIFRYLTEGPNPPPRRGYEGGRHRRSNPYPTTSPRRAERSDRTDRTGGVERYLLGGDGAPVADADWRRDWRRDLMSRDRRES